MPNEILIPSQSLISCFLEPPHPKQASGSAQLRESGEATPQYVRKEYIQYFQLSPSSCLCAKEQSCENCEQRSGI